MISRGPIFNLIPIDLSVDGFKDFNEAATFVCFVRAEDGTGSLSVDAKVSVNLGDVTSDAIPMAVNTHINLKNMTNVLRFKWSAQPGITAYILVSGDDGISIGAPPPKTTISMPVSNTLSTATYSPGTIPVLIAAASATRASVIVQNRGMLPVYIGGSDVAVSTGIRINPGEVMTIDKTLAAIYAVCSWTGGIVNVMVEK